jgi:RNA polymerase sigma-70 factor (ECF subfamily)
MGLTNPEAEIVVLFQKGDQQAFEQLYDQYAPMLFGVVSRLVPDTSLASHILQQTFILLWQNRTSYNPGKERIFTWMNKYALATAVAAARQQEGTEEGLRSNQDSSFYVSVKDNR